MGRFLISQLVHRRGRTLTLAVGILVAAVSFTLLTSAARTSELTVKRIVKRNFRPAYDILVRPQDSFTDIERERGLVRENYLSGIYGGISMRQWLQVKRVSGVEVAAPIANVGYVMPFTTVPIETNEYLGDQEFQMYRLRFTWVANGGLSHYPSTDWYVYYTRRDRFAIGPNGRLQEVLPDGDRAEPCAGFLKSKERKVDTDQFMRRSPGSMMCYSELSPERRMRFALSDTPLARGNVGVTSEAFFPMFVAAIDPVEEQKLVDLDETIVKGRALESSDRLRTARIPRDTGHIVPVIASARTYVDEVLSIDLERLRLPGKIDIPRRLSRPIGTHKWVASLPGDNIAEETRSLSPLYEKLLNNYTKDPATWKAGRITYAAYYVPSDVSYRHIEEDRLRPEVVQNDPALTYGGYYGSGWVPLQNADTNFRKLDPHNMHNATAFHIVGRFDPDRLPGFSELSDVPLETYYPPKVEPADPRSREALNGRPLLPTQSITDYIAQPPMLLTTLKAARGFRDPDFFLGTYDDKPISVIRVRVAGVKGPDPLSRERIKNVAAAIRNRTGLAVDITAGSSPRPVLIELPKGKFGRPELLLREGWVEKGVAVRFLDAVDRKSVVLFGLILVICGFFLANAAFASVRARRKEIGTLMCLGWSRAKLFAAVLSELGAVGLAAGIVGTAIAAAVVAAFDLDMPLVRTLWVVPVATVLALISGIAPAWRAAQAEPLDAVRPSVVAPRRPHPVKGIAAMGAANLRRAPGRTVVASSGLVLGVGALTLLLALNQALQGTLVGTLMGNFISVQVRAVDIVSVVLVIALGAASVADVMFVNLKERAAEFATLSTSGWSDRQLAALALTEGAGMGLLGSATGAALGLSVAALIRGVAVAPSTAVAVAVALGGTLVAVAACALPVAGLSRLTPTTVLAEE